jgi:hypothetical protein
MDRNFIGSGPFVVKKLINGFVFCASGVLSLGCSEPGVERLWPAWSEGSASTNAGHRTLSYLGWDTIATIKPNAEGGAPVGFIVNREGFGYYDAVRQQILLYDKAGAEVRTSAEALSATDSLLAVRDLQLLPTGELAILEANAATLFVLSTNLKSAKRIRLQTTDRVERFIPYGKSSFLLWTFHSSTPFIIVDSTGAVVRTLEFPWVPYGQLHYMSRSSGQLTRVADDEWVFTFGLGNGWLFQGGGNTTGSFRHYVEPMPFPAVYEEIKGPVRTARMGRISVAAISAATIDGVLYVLFGGKTRLRGQVIDAYQLSNGRYLRSIVAPGQISGVTVYEHKLYFLTSGSPMRVLGIRRETLANTASSRDP